MPAETPAPSDETLLQLILLQQPNWRDLVSQLLQRHHAALVARCNAYLRNREDAEDAAQEAELRAFRAIRSFRLDASFRTWLFAIGERQCHDLVRRRSRHLLDDHLRALIEIHDRQLLRNPDATEQCNLVKQILDRLPRRERDVLMLRFYVDLPLQDIAKYLDLGLSATKMRLYRALEMFGATLQAEQRA